LFDDEKTTWGREFYEQAERDGWIETQVHLHGDETQTWLRPGNRPHELDHVFCDAGLAERLTGSRSLPKVVSFLGLSDHAPLIVDFDLDITPAMSDPAPALEGAIV
jgi:exonuclease III